MPFEIFLGLVLLTFSVLVGCFLLATLEFGKRLFRGLNIRLQTIRMRIFMKGIRSQSDNEVSGAEETDETDKTKNQKHDLEPDPPITTDRKRSPVEGNREENPYQTKGRGDQCSNDIPT